MVNCSKHSYDRCKERVGLNNKASERLAEKAFNEGISIHDVNGSQNKLNKLITAITLKNNQRDNLPTTRIYGRNIYIFSKYKLLITVIPLPKQYNDAVDKVMKRKKEQQLNAAQ